MPNWCENRIDVKGNPADILKMAEVIKGEKTEFDFDKVIPYPEMYAKLDADDVEWHSKGFQAGGYDWCIDNWDTKWNTDGAQIDVYGDGATISFLTANSPSLKVTGALSKMFPDLLFVHNYEEGGMDYSGFVEFKGGKSKTEAQGGYNRFPITEHDEEDAWWGG